MWILGQYFVEYSTTVLAPIWKHLGLKNSPVPKDLNYFWYEGVWYEMQKNMHLKYSIFTFI